MLKPESYRVVSHVHQGRRRAVSLCTLLLLALCLSSLTVFAQPARRATSARVPTAKPVPEEIMLRIVRAEDERRWDANDLGALFADKNAAVRARAALAAGRIGDEGACAPLIVLLQKDSAASVRAWAAFALGEIESAQGAD